MNIFWNLIIYLKIVHLSICNRRYWFKNLIISFKYQLIVNIAHLYTFVHIYDSLNDKCLKEDKVLINRLFPNNLQLKITFVTVQSQTNSYVISSL